MVHKPFQIKKSFGFTLLELVIVMGLLGVLSVGGFTSYVATNKNRRDGQRRIDLESLRQGLEAYRSDNSSLGYPNVTTGSTETYLKPALTAPITYFSSANFPKDPYSTQNYFYYYQRVTANTYRLCAFLENKKSTDPACPNAAAQCKTVAPAVLCNFGLTQP